MDGHELVEHGRHVVEQHHRREVAVGIPGRRLVQKHRLDLDAALGGGGLEALKEAIAKSTERVSSELVAEARKVRDQLEKKVE